MKVEIWSDVACPWFYVGKLSLDAWNISTQAAGEKPRLTFISRRLSTVATSD
jgi:predicted DsbA family dithiol-disulfide isomerase